MALLIPAHNEALVISATLRSAIAAGMNRDDIYVVNDASTDKTVKRAKSIISKQNIYTVKHSGKAMALDHAFVHFDMINRYEWVHIADADGRFALDYFAELEKGLTKDIVAATGHVQSMKGGWVSDYRVYEYTIGLEIYRRLQNLFGTITVIPGATACFRTKTFAKLDKSAGFLTEDFDMTLQIHRQKLGKIKFIPKAKAYTQDPLTYHDYVKQIKRWYRGFWQGIKQHKVGTKAQRIDLYLAIIIAQSFYYTGSLLVYIPVTLISPMAGRFLSLYFLFDLVYFLGWTMFGAVVNRRFDIFGSFPFFYLLRATNMVLFCYSGIEVMLSKRKQFATLKSGWDSPVRYRN